MKIPLTLAIVPALIVTCAGDRYAIPQVNLLELVRIEPEQVKDAVENVHGAPVYRLRGNLLPLVYLDKELEVDSPRNGASGSAAESAAEKISTGVSIVVLRAEEQQFGLVVDEVNDAEEIVVKPLSRNLKSVSAYSGATIMGDGRVALILDVLGLAHRSRVLSKSQDRIMKDATEETDKQPVQTETLLLFADESESRMAIPLASASRLEEFPRAEVEEVGGKEVVQYRGEIMPLIHICDVIQDRRKNLRGADDAPIAQREFLQVVVFASDGRNLGLVIGKVLDIVMQDMGALSAASREGVRGCAVIQSKVTELIDLEFIAQHVMSDAAASRQPVNATSEA